MTVSTGKSGVPRHFTDLSTVSAGDLRAILDDAGRRKAMIKAGEREAPFAGKVLAVGSRSAVAAQKDAVSSSECIGTQMAGLFDGGRECDKRLDDRNVGVDGLRKGGTHGSRG